MLLVDIYKIPISMALGTVAAVLAISVIASILFPPKAEGTTTAVNSPEAAPNPDPHAVQDQ